MTRYFIINNQSPAANYGIGTYVRSLVACLKNSFVDLQVVLVEMLSEQREFAIATDENDNIIMQMPSCNLLQEDVWYNQCASYHMAKWIKSNCLLEDRLVFHFNYAQHASLAYALKTTFTSAEILFTIHYQAWCFLLKGSQFRLKKLVSNADESLLSEAEIDIRHQVLSQISAEKQMLVIADHIICLSDFTRNVVVDDYRIDAGKLCTIPNFIIPTKVATNEHRRAWPLCFDDSHKKYLLYAGRLDDNKGVRLLIRAFRYIHEKYPYTHLVIVGEGDFTVMDEADCIWEYISFTGRIPQETLYELYSRAYIGIHPSLNEQCSYTVIEMMMHGLPVIGTDSTGLNEMLPNISYCKVHIDERRLHEGFRVNDLACKVKALLQNENLRNIIAQKVKQTYQKKYAQSVHLEKFISGIVSKKQTPITKNVDLLETLDSNALQIINSRPECMDLDFFGLSGVGLYMVLRIQSKRLSRERRALLEEHLVYLVDWISEIVGSSLSLQENPYLLLFVKRLQKLDFYKTVLTPLASKVLPTKLPLVSNEKIIHNQLKIYVYNQ